MNTGVERKIMQIAEDYARTIGYSLKHRFIYFDKNNKMWKQMLEGIAEQDSDEAKKYKDELETYDFQAIGFRLDDPKDIGGDLWIFVDKKTDTVITYVEGV